MRIAASLCAVVVAPVTAAGSGQSAAAPGPGGPALIEVFKPDGSRQCEPDSGTPSATLREALKAAGVEVHASRTTTDGMAHAQVCGAPTGRIHVFSIDATAAATAADLGFLPAAAIAPPPGAAAPPPMQKGPPTP